MGVCLSRNPSSLSTIVSNVVRIVHLNGWVEDFDFPVSVSQLTGSPPKHFIFTAAQLLSPRLKPLKADTLLERGCLYFILPSSTFQAGISLADLTAIVKRLTSKAKSCKVEVRSPGSSRSNPSSSLSTDPENDGVKKWRPVLDTIRE